MSQLAFDSLDALFDKAAAPVADAYLALLAADAPAVTRAQLQSAINALTHVFRAAQRDKVAALNASLEADSTLSPAAVALLADAWAALSQEGVLVRRAQKNRAGAANTAAVRTLQVGKLVSIDWRLGCGVASSACADLAAPFVTLQLTVADSFGATSVKTMELSIAQFQRVAKDFRDIAARLDSV